MTPISKNLPTIPDKDLVGMILNGSEEAGVFLVYEKYDRDIDYFAMKYYDTLEYKEDLVGYLYLHIRGKDGGWAPLRGFAWRCSLRTWFSSVASHLFLEKRKELIGLGDYSHSIDTPEGAPIAGALMQDDQHNAKMVMLMEAISRLANDDYRFILIKELEGYAPKEIAQLLGEKRQQENRLKTVPTADYVYMIKGRALREVKVLVNQVRKEWYESN